MKEQLDALLSKEVLLAWNELTATIDSLYDVERLWNKGFGDWKIEYKRICFEATTGYIRKNRKFT